MKDMFPLWEVERIFTHIIPNLMHHNDGLILTLNGCPYFPGTCEDILKWKPLEQNTIDFKLQKIQQTNLFGLYSFKSEGKAKTDVLFDLLFFRDRQEEEKLWQGQPFIVECHFDPEFETERLLEWNKCLDDEAGDDP